MNNAGAALEMSLFQGGMMSVFSQRIPVKTWDKLKRLFELPPIKPNNTEKRSLVAWSPALYEAGERRAKANVKSVTALVYDYDDTSVPPDQVKQSLVGKNLRFAIYTTWSHTPEKPRYRVILFLSRSLGPNEYEKAWTNGIDLIGFPDVDQQAKDISRNYIMPIRRNGFPYHGFFHLGTAINTDTLLQGEPVLTRDTKLVLEGQSQPTADSDVLARAEGKYKCACPFQVGSSPGSAFLRVTKDGRALLVCTSSRHLHAESKYWLRKSAGSGEGKGKGRRSGPRSVETRGELLQEVSDEMLRYAETKIAYSAPQGVFYRYQDGAWQIGSPLKKDSLLYHFVGLLPRGCDDNHGRALIDHILSRQIYGFDCISSEGIWIEQPTRTLNLYAKPDIVPRPGNFDRVDQIVSMLAANDSKAKEWLTHWSAALVQNPERRSMVAVLCMSPYQGIGKSLYGRILAKMIGTGNAGVVSNRALRDRFNANYVTKLLVLADEVGVDSRSQDVLSELKSYITDEEVHCAAPYAQRVKVKNRMSWWLTSNARRPLIVDTQDRRITVLAVQKPSPEYKKMLDGCFVPKSSTFSPSFLGEVEAFCDYLRTIQIDWRLIATPFQTEARRQIQLASQSGVEKFIEMVQKKGAVSVISDYPPPPEYFRLSDSAYSRAVPCETLYGSYTEWSSRNGRRDTRPEPELRLAFTLLGNVKVRNAAIGGRNVPLYVGLPSVVTPNSDNNVVTLPTNK